MREKQVYQFANFRLDTGERVLESGGRPISITPKALEVLIALVENRGHIVEKENLMRQVWPGTFVEENNLAFNISALRKLLGENSASPRFIETIPKRGYRFIADVIQIPADGLAGALEGGGQAGDERPTDSSGTVDAARRGRSVGRVALIAGAVLAVASAAVFMVRFEAKAKLSDRDTIVLADFENKTGDPAFDGTLRQGLSIELEQSPFISLISDERIRHALRLMSQPADAPLRREMAREVCERTGSAAVLEGSIASLGSAYVLTFEAKNCASGDVLDHQQLEVRRKEDVLDAVSRIARRFRSRMGESRASLKEHDKPLIEVTMPSLEALKAYTASIRVGYARGCAASAPYGRLAVELDPQFAMAHSHLGRCYSNLGENVLSQESIAKAYELRERASDRERFYITANYDRQVTGNLQKAQEACELWAHTYPRDATSYGTLAGTIDQGVGKFEDSVRDAEKAITVNPDMAPAYVALGFANLYLDRPGEAANVLRRASARDLDTPDLLLLRYYTAFLNGDPAEMERVAVRARGRAGAEDAMSHTQSLFYARAGRIRMARDLWRCAIDLAQQAGQSERAATYETAGAVWEALFGNLSAAKQGALDALARSKGRDVEYGAALALALAGDGERAKNQVNDLEKQFPEDTFVRFSYLPVMRGLMELKRGEASRAIEALQSAAADETAVPGIALFAFLGSLYPAYVRGEAYLALDKGAEAAAEFEKLLNHRGVVLADPVGAMARVQLGRALAMAGQREKAKKAYEDFFALWKDADSDVPILQQARAEYRKL